MPVTRLAVLALLLAGCHVRPKVPPQMRDTLGGVHAVRLLVLNFETMEAAEASAFCVGDGIYVTCAHVLRQGQPLGVVLRDGTRAPFTETIAVDDASDLALFRVKVDDECPRPCLSTPPAAGTELRAMTGDGVTLVRLLGMDEDPEIGEVLLLAAPGLGPGASGGAVVDEWWRIVGVIRRAVDDDPMQCRAVPAARLAELLGR